MPNPIDTRFGQLASQNVRATEWERRVLLQAGYVPVCAHNHVTFAVHRDRTIDNNRYQNERAAECVARQRAAIAAAKEEQ